MSSHRTWGRINRNRTNARRLLRTDHRRAAQPIGTKDMLRY